MASKLKLLNENGKVLELSSGSITSDKQLDPRDFKYIRDTVKDMLELDGKLEDGDVVFLKGYHSINDRGGGTFIYNASGSKQEHNGGTIIDPSKEFPENWNDQDSLDTWFNTTNTSKGVLERVYNDSVKPSWFGAVGDGITDDTLSIQKSIDSYDTIIFNDKEYFISNTIKISNRKNMNIYSNCNSTISKPSTIRDDDDSVFLFDNCPGSRISGFNLIPSSNDNIYILKRWNTDGTWIRDDEYIYTGSDMHPLLYKWNGELDLLGHQQGNEPQGYRDWYTSSTTNIIYNTNTSPRIIMKNADNYIIENITGIFVLLEIRNTSNSVIRNNNIIAGKGTWGSIRIDCQETAEYGIDNIIENNIIKYGTYSSITVSRTKRTKITGNIIYRSGESGIKTDQNIGSNYSRRNYKCIISGNVIKQTCYDGIDFMTDNISNNSIDTPRTGDYSYDEYPPYMLPTKHIITNNKIEGCHGAGLWGDGSGLIISNNSIIDGNIAGAKLKTSNTLFSGNIISNNNKTNTTGNSQITSSGITTTDYPDNIAINNVITNNIIIIDDDNITVGDKIWFAAKNTIVAHNKGIGNQGTFNVSSGINNIKYLNSGDNETNLIGVDTLIKTQLTNIDGTSVMSGIQLLDNGNKGQISTSTIESGKQYHWQMYAAQGLIANFITEYENLKILTNNTSKRIYINNVSFNQNGEVIISNLPTSDPGVVGQLWNDNGTVKVSAG